jgi:hypothetical protein
MLQALKDPRVLDQSVELASRLQAQAGPGEIILS